MANYHILKCSNKLHEINVVFHIQVPDETNAVGYNLRTAVKDDVKENTSDVPWLETGNPTEYAAIQNGEVYEWMEIIKVNADLSVGDKRNIIDARYTVLSTAGVTYLQNIYKYYGLDRDVT